MADAFSEMRDAFSNINLAFSASRSRRCVRGGGGNCKYGDGGEGYIHVGTVGREKVVGGEAYKLEGS